MEIVLSQSFELEHCVSCGVAFAIPTELLQQLKRNHGSFFCPNGHSQSYRGPNAAEREAAQSKLWLEQERERSARLVAELETKAREAKRLTRRIGNGVCPCCNRTFGDLQKHMNTKHADFAKALPPPSGGRQIAAPGAHR